MKESPSGFETWFQGSMIIPFIILLPLILVSCSVSQKRAPLTAAQAQTLAIRLANDKADALFHRRPFEGNQPAQFVAGRWMWTDSRGVGLRDFRARVELAVDGSTNLVDVVLWDSALDRER